MLLHLPSINPTHNILPTMVRYKECLKNHAASIGGSALDGCGEFIPTNDRSLKCAACSCHRNFHRQEVEGGNTTFNLNHHRTQHNSVLIGQLGPDQIMGFPSVLGAYTASEIEDHGDELAAREVGRKKKKRVRTKFSQEQKEKMLRFAENAGWKMVKLEDSAVNQFCQEIGIKRRVLKVWMHNNKHNYANKISITP